jgi:hypothetical protein
MSYTEKRNTKTVGRKGVDSGCVYSWGEWGWNPKLRKEKTLYSSNIFPHAHTEFYILIKHLCHVSTTGK